ncbi:MAG TPA: DUF1800 domain-containing protein [Phycisphaerae bacterium]|nr:DUF1800 domain-containing protein [Phycisphaerae bacterium]
MSLKRFVAEQLGLTASAPSADSVLSRRKMLLGGAAAFAAVSARPPQARAVPPGSANRFLVDRITFGWTPEEQNQADSLGYHEYLERQLDYHSIDDSAMEARLESYEMLDYIPYHMHNLVNVSVAYRQLYEATILRAVQSKRQLYQRMVEFWTDHFNINLFSGECAWIKNWDDKNVIRVHALGSFRELLSASMHSACMLHYLNNELSVWWGPNENYARELMELHTLGVDGGYTQQDVVEVARCLTGWDFHRPDNYDRQMFRFAANHHDFDAKTVLGHAIPAGQGIEDGEMVCDILASHPSTARYLATKLCRKFWSENPPVTLIDAVTATYTATDGDIKAMLRTLFTTLDPSLAGPKFKRPFHLVVSALRATKASYETTGAEPSVALFNRLANMGHLPFNWAPPDGYPDRADFWVGSPLTRWNFAARLVNGNITYLSVDPAAFFATAATADQLMGQIQAKLFGGRLTAEERNLIRDYLATDPASPSIRLEAIGLALAAPSFQWY